jgi:hypothetical protein
MDDRTLATAIDDLPSALTVWHDGPSALPRLLSMCILERLREADTHRPTPRADGTMPADPRNQTNHVDRWRHATSTLVTWHSTYGLPEATPVPAPRAGPAPRNRAAARRARRRVSHQGTVTLRDYNDAVTLAAAWWELDSIRVGLRTGDMTIRSNDSRHVRLHNNRRAEIEVLDIVLSQVTFPPDTMIDPARLVAPAPGFGHERVDPLIRWLQGHALPPEHLHHPHGGTGMGPRHPDAHLVVNAIPSRLRNQAWTRTEDDLCAQSTTVSENTDLGGLSLAAARTCYAFLITQLNINYAAGVLLGTPELFMWAIRPGHLITALCSRVTEQEARAFVDLCTHAPGRSPASAPLLRHGNQLLIPAELVSPVAFERTLLRAASANPGTSGRLGNVLGKRGERWQQRLATIPGCEVAAEVRIRDQHGRSAGDLDVVAWDRDADVMLIVETKWPVDAATLIESNKVDATFDKGRAQLNRIRAGLGDGSIVIDWPPGWDGPLPTTTIHWWVGSAQQLDSRPQPDDDVTTTSLRLVENVLPAHSLSDLVTRLAGFPLPRERLEYHLMPQAVRAGPLTLTYDAIHIADGPPAPPQDRRVHLGWT